MMQFPDNMFTNPSGQRDLPFMTSTLEGGGGPQKANEGIDKLRVWDGDKGEG